jgi:hypothetical protein
MQKIKTLVYILATVFGMTFVSGVFGINISDGMLIIFGLIELIVIVWLVLAVSKI